MPEFVKQHYQHILPSTNSAAIEKTKFPAPEPAPKRPPVEVETESGNQALTPMSILIAHRRERKISQGEMAKQLGISQSYYSLLEGGSRKANAAIERAILQLLHEASAQNGLS